MNFYLNNGIFQLCKMFISYTHFQVEEFFNRNCVLKLENIKKIITSFFEMIEFSV